MHPFWCTLSLVALGGGMLVLFFPKLTMRLNQQLNKTLGSFDELIMKYRYIVGVTLLIVSYLCFRLARLV